MIMNSVKKQIWGQSHIQVGDQVSDEVGYQFRIHVDKQVSNLVYGQVCDQVRHHIWDQINE
jgi:hypothetical protein